MLNCNEANNCLIFFHSFRPNYLRKKNYFFTKTDKNLAICNFVIMY